MTLRQLEYFVAVAELGSFTRAAERLMVSQPALSHQIRALEKSLSSTLLTRPPDRVGLTPRGRVFLRYASEVLGNARAAQQAARAVADTESGELRVSTLYSIAIGIVPVAIGAWRRAHPGVRVEMLEFGHPDALIAEMARGVGDVAVGPLPASWLGRARPLGHEEFVLVLPSDDPLLRKGRKTIRLEVLADRRWVLYADDHGLSDVIARACGAAGFAPRAAARTQHTRSALALASAGLGPTLVPSNVVGPAFSSSVLRPSPPVRRTLAAFTRSQPSQLAVAFIDVLAEHATL